MTRRLLGAAVLVAAVLAVCAQEASAFGKRASYAAPSCVTSGGACCGSYTVSYVDQKVTVCTPVWKTRKVDVEVVEHVWVDTPYKYTVCVPVMKKEKVKVCETTQVKQPYTYTVYTPVHVNEKVKVCTHTWVTKDQPYSWMEPVYVKSKQKRLVCEVVCVPTTVSYTVTPPAPCGWVSRCCGHAAPCPPPCPQVVTCTVMKPTTVTKEVEVEVVNCTYVRKEGVRKVNVCVPVWVDKDVVVCKSVPVQKEGFRIVCVPVWVEKLVDVCSHTWVEKEGVAKVCKPVTVKKTVEQSYCELVKTETVVKVPVAVPCPTPCVAYAPTCGMTGGCGGCR